CLRLAWLERFRPGQLRPSRDARQSAALDSTGITLHVLTVYRNCVPCWAVRALLQMEDERQMIVARPLLLIAILLLLSPTPDARKFDVVVYGGTAGGVITAVAAAREGLRVALLEPSGHVGGMMAGGLSWTDHGKKEVIGGYSREVFERAGKQYGISMEW